MRCLGCVRPVVAPYWKATGMRKPDGKILCAMMIALASALPIAAAGAAPVTFTGALAAEAPGRNNAMTLGLDMLAGPLDFTLDEGESVTIDLFRLWNTTLEFRNSGIQNQNVDVDLSFGSLGSIGTLRGAVRGDVTKQDRRFLFHSGSIDFSSAPLAFVFGEQGDGLLNVTLSDATFGTGLAGAGIVRGTFSLLSAPQPVVRIAAANLLPTELPQPLGAPEDSTAQANSPAEVAEPAMLLLFGAALIALAARGLRRAA